MQIERINAIPFTYFHWQNFIILNLFFSRLLWVELFMSRFCILAYLINVVFMYIFYYNTQIYWEILLQFLQFTEKYYVIRTPFHFRYHAEAMLRLPARLSKAFSTARPSTSKNDFIRRSKPCYMKKFWHASALHDV